jgi:hypothetical protein
MVSPVQIGQAPERGLVGDSAGQLREGPMRFPLPGQDVYALDSVRPFAVWSSATRILSDPGLWSAGRCSAPARSLVTNFSFEVPSGTTNY